MPVCRNFSEIYHCLLLISFDKSHFKLPTIGDHLFITTVSAESMQSGRAKRDYSIPRVYHAETLSHRRNRVPPTHSPSSNCVSPLSEGGGGGTQFERLDRMPGTVYQRGVRKGEEERVLVCPSLADIWLEREDLGTSLLLCPGKIFRDLL